MPANFIKYTTGTIETGCLKRGNMLIGNNTADYGTFYTGISPASSGYTIYLNKPTGGPSIYTPANGTDMISITNSQVAGSVAFPTTYVSVEECLVYYSSQADKICLNRDYEGISTEGLTLDVDAGFSPSYPATGTSWYDISVSEKTTTLLNGPTYATGNYGMINLDGLDDYVDCLTAAASDTTCTVSVWVRTSSTASGTRYIWGWAQAGPFTSQNNIAALSGGANIAVICRDSVPTVTVQVNSTGFTLNDNVWHNIVLVRNGRTVYLYIDGALNNSGTAGSDFGTFNNVPMYIGKHPGLDSTVFNGSIGKVLVYESTALTATQVAANWNASRSIYGR